MFGRILWLLIKETQTEKHRKERRKHERTAINTSLHQQALTSPPRSTAALGIQSSSRSYSGWSLARNYSENDPRCCWSAAQCVFIATYVWQTLDSIGFVKETVPVCAPGFFYCRILVLWGHRFAAKSVTAASKHRKHQTCTRCQKWHAGGTGHEEMEVPLSVSQDVPFQSLLHDDTRIHKPSFSLAFKTQPECQQQRRIHRLHYCVNLPRTVTSSNNRPMRGHRHVSADD